MNYKKIVSRFEEVLANAAPSLSKDKEKRMYNIINSDLPNIRIYGLKRTKLDQTVRDIDKEFSSATYQEAVNVFKNLIASNIHEEKFAGIYYLNRFKRDFTEETIKLFYRQFKKHCTSWPICDSTMIKVIGPFLAKKKNQDVAMKTIFKWAKSDNMWIRRASMVVMLKIFMIQKTIEKEPLFRLVNHMLKYENEPYINKGIGWLLKTSSKYDPKSIASYLKRNKEIFPKIVLRTASEKLNEKDRKEILY